MPYLLFLKKKTAKFVVCCKLQVALYGLIQCFCLWSVHQDKIPARQVVCISRSLKCIKCLIDSNNTMIEGNDHQAQALEVWPLHLKYSLKTEVRN